MKNLDELLQDVPQVELKHGLLVSYVPAHAKHGFIDDLAEFGIITSWTDSFVFVRFGNDKTSKATRYEDLYVIGNK